MMNAIAATQDRAVRLRRVLDAPPERVFRAWTEPAELERWFGPRGFSARVVALEPQVGGRYELAMIPEEGQARTVAGRYREFSPPARLVFTWAWGDGADEAHRDRDRESLVTIEFRPLEAGTEVVLTHERLSSAEAREGHRQGWSGSLERLGEHLS